MKNFTKIGGGVLAPHGFRGGVAACGIKGGRAVRDDLALVVSDFPAIAAATFTTNKVKAAPVLVSMEHMKTASKRAVILNSGNANACTGAAGLVAARTMAAAAARAAECGEREVLVCSTGRIGVPLPTARVETGMASIKLSRGAGTRCARAIMTSDTFPKQISFVVGSGRRAFRVGAMAKGAGMINPDMATMLCLVTTDAIVPAASLRAQLKAAVGESFNRITVDGDMSTNDTVIVLANGSSGVVAATDVFRETLTTACAELARMIVRDGEGVSRFVEVLVRGAASASDARRAAEAVANSTLVKCAWAGGDPNWGRIMDALGYCGARMVESATSIDYGGLPIVRGGMVAATPWPMLRAVAARKAFRVEIDLGLGSASHEVWTTDLTEEYVRLNLGE